MTRILRLLLIAAIALPLWQPVAAQTIDVCGATPNVSSEFVPVYGYWIDTQDVESQMIYPASKFNGLTGGNKNQIDAITFYCAATGAEQAVVPESLGGATVVVRMGETYNTTISTRSEMVSNRNNMEIVYEGHLPTGSNGMKIDFQTPYVYQGNNILIDIYVKTPSTSCDHCNWQGEEQGGDITAWNNKNGGESFLPKMTITYSEFHEQVLDFGKRLKGENVSYTEPVTVANSSNATEVKLENGAPFSILSRNGDDITIKFAPTDASSYTDYLIVTIDGKNTSVRITGIGIGAEGEGPVATRDEAFFKTITYDWTDNAGTSHTSNLSEIATDPDQIIAMLKEVYTNQSIPGNLYRSNEKGSNDNYNDVLYTAVGKITRSGNGNYWNPYQFSYDNAYGWGIDGTIETTNNNSNAHFKIDEYKPNEEGVTLLLLEQVDEFNPADSETATQFNRNPTHDYVKLRQIISESIKSARVVTEAKRTGDKNQKTSGTLFKVDCDKMNNFFFLAKGQLAGFFNNEGSYYHPNSHGGTYYDNGLSSSYLDKEPALFCHMFEQLSPAQTTSTGQAIDIYQQLITGDSFPIVHECPCIPYCYGTGHGFSMYNSDYSGDCADVRDMLFFVPDYRMMYHSNRTGDNSSRDYFNYHTEHAPTMGLYVITQDPITGDQVSGKDMYQLTLKWNSNLDKFLSSDQQEYQLYQVVLDEYGTEQFVPVYYMNSDGQYLSGPNGSVVTTPVQVLLTLSPTEAKTYTEVYVPMQESSQQVTFAVRGQDATHFLDLKTSNYQDFVIPGLDPNELVELTDATHYSRFNPQTVKNCYSNKIDIANTAMGLVNANITGGENGTKLTILRSHNETVDGATTKVSKPIAYITFDKTSSKYTVTMANQDAKTEFPEGKNSQNTGKYAGYHANGPSHNIEENGNWSQSYTVDGGYVDFGSLSIYDNFVVSVADNNHPNVYTYQMTSNYVGTPSSVYMSIIDVAEAIQDGGAVFYACTWNNGQAQKWVKGESMNSDNTLFRFSLLKDNFIFCRMNPACENDGNEPGWSFRWNQSGDMITSDHLGKTYYVYNVEMNSGNWDNNNTTPEYAHSNSFRVPVYKTDSKINNVYTLKQVDAEDEETGGATFENDDLTFEEKLQYSSKKDILRYDVYRWGETEKRFIVDKVTGKDNEEQDLSPTGQADNQDGWYTTKINAEPGEDVTVPYGSTDKWALFLDPVPENESTAQAFTYAPVVETFTKGKTADNANKDRTDYNTYGGPLQNAATGKFAIAVETPTSNNPLMSEYTWTKEGKKYCYYNLKLKFNNPKTNNQFLPTVPDGYQIYKIRVWREIDEKYLGEQFDALQGRVSDCYKFDEIVYTDVERMDDFLHQSYALGSAPGEIEVPYYNSEDDIVYNCGTFGARKVRTNEPESDTSVLDEDIDVSFFARIYFTRESNLPTTQTQSAPRPRAVDNPIDADYADGKFYMVEAKVDYVIVPGNDIPTGVIQNLNTREVVGVKYYNTLGIESSTPFDGVNIVVTRYSDGSTTTTKILK